MNKSTNAIYEWRILVRRTAAGVGALCGLVSLMVDAPAWVACVRGGAACFLIAVLGRQGERVLASSAGRAAAEESDRELPSTATAPAPEAGAEAVAPSGSR
ncbi:hypothetical protein Pla163_36150 [Planctomycetes bacterium Pla163]|uniref:Uncharacterized protein n=1 Tax=Rohdeia mirabilis TaxID=2528008 RepID=A0A518D4S5_9BACT|nr:hypothetical protein Pla163_36150 [Planctomycetes bacterium Pla163]